MRNIEKSKVDEKVFEGVKECKCISSGGKIIEGICSCQNNGGAVAKKIAVKFGENVIWLGQTVKVGSLSLDLPMPYALSLRARLRIRELKLFGTSSPFTW